MFVVVGALLGALTGALIAHRRKGRWLDILQYAVVYTMVFAVLGLFATIIVHRLAV